MTWPIQHPALHCRPLQLRDQRLEKASLFPFFDRQGTTRLLMLTTEDSAHIALIEHRTGLFTRRWFRPSHLDLDFGDLRNATEADNDRLLDLWHFDPWWELGEARYAGHPAVPALKATNIPGHDDGWQRAWFDGTLDRVRYVMTGKGDEFKLQRYTPALLARAEAERAHDATRCLNLDPFKPWRLQPFWESSLRRD